MSDNFFVDTNVLVYVRDPTDLVKHARAREWILRLWKERSGRLSIQVLQEYYAVVTRKLRPGLDPVKAREEIRALASWDPVLLDASIAERAWHLEARYSISWWDALIVAAAQRANCTYLLTEDLQHGMHFDSVEVVDPFQVPP